MAFYYVKSGGSAGNKNGGAGGDGGRAASERTGTWNASAADYYNDIKDLIDSVTTAPVSGDRIRCSDLHVYDNSAVSMTLTIPDGVSVESVDDTAQNQYKKGATERSSNANNNTFLQISSANQGIVLVVGMKLEAGQFIYAGGNNTKVFLLDCALKTYRTGNSSAVSANSTGNLFWLENCTIDWTTGTGHRCIFGTTRIAGFMVMRGCTCTGGFYGNTYLFSNAASYGGGGFFIENNDFSAVNTNQLSGYVSSGSEGVVSFTFNNNLLPASHPPIFQASNNGLFGVSAGSSSSDDYFGYETAEHVGASEVDVSTYNNSGATYDGTNEFSISLDTTAETCPARPLTVKLVEFSEVDLSVAKTVTVEIEGGASLLSKDVFIDLYSSDSAAQVQMNRYTSREANILSGTTGLTTSAATWTGGAGNTYKITIDISAETGVTKGKVLVYAGVALASATVNFDMPTIADT